MKRIRIVLVALLIAVTACGGDSDDDAGGGGDGGSDTTSESSGGDATGFDSGFGEGDLPAGFPSDLIPPSFSSGQILDISGQEVVAFRSEQSFDDALEHFTGVLGEGQLIEAGDSRQAQWLSGPGWAVALFVTGESPLEITMTKTEN